MDLKEFSRIAQGKDYITGYFRNQELVMEGVRKNVRGRFTQWRIRSLQKKHSLPGWDPKLVRSGCNHSIRQGFLQAIREQYGSYITAMVNNKCRILSSYRELTSGEVQSAVTLADRMQVETENRKTVNQFLTSVAENDPSAVPPTLYDRIGKEKGALLLQGLTRKTMEKAALSPGGVVPAEELEISVKTRYRSLVRDMRQALSGLPDPAEWEKTFLQKMMLDPSVLDIPESERPTLFSMLIQQYGINRREFSKDEVARFTLSVDSFCREFFGVTKQPKDGIDRVKTLWNSLWRIHQLRWKTARELVQRYPSERSYLALYLKFTHTEYCILPFDYYLPYFRLIRDSVPFLIQQSRDKKTAVTPGNAWNWLFPFRPMQPLPKHEYAFWMLANHRGRDFRGPSVCAPTVAATPVSQPLQPQTAVAVIPSRTSTERDELGHRLEYMIALMEKTVMDLGSRWTWYGHSRTVTDLIDSQANEKKELIASFLVQKKYQSCVNPIGFNDAILAMVNFWVFAGELAKQYGCSIYLKLPASKDDMFQDFQYRFDNRKELLRAMPDRKYAVFNLGNQTETQEKLRERVTDIVSHLDRFCTEAYILYAPSDISLDDPFFK